MKKLPLSITHPEIVKQWDYKKNGNLTPDQVSCGSHKKVWWLCKKGHEDQVIISSKIRKGYCSFCSGRKVNKDNCLASTHPYLIREWHSTKNGGITPYEVTKGSEIVIFWKCNKGHEWNEKINKRTKIKNGGWF